ncbi:MAG TPA: hypothetical protein VJ622_20380 [Acidimicrobiia bacterium]|nr:hypothetical protein [Acidimicrobiia bacterium]
MFKRVLCAAGLAGVLFVAAPTAAFAHDGWRHGRDGCGRAGWHGHNHWNHHRHGDNWNHGWNHSNDGWNSGWNHGNDGWGGWNGWSGL